METLDLQELAAELDELNACAADHDDALDTDGMARLIELRAFAESFRSDTGYDLEDIARNEPYAVSAYDFQDYAQELAFDTGMIDEKSQMASYIDWTAWARDVQMDYTSFTYEGTEYYVRAY